MLRYFLLFLSGLLLLILLSVGIFSPKTTSQIVAQSYPPEDIEDFVRDCTGDRGLVVEAACRCIIREVENVYSWSEFQEVDQQIKTTGDIPEPMQKIITDCQEDPFS